MLFTRASTSHIGDSLVYGNGSCIFPCDEAWQQRCETWIKGREWQGCSEPSGWPDGVDHCGCACQDIGLKPIICKRVAMNIMPVKRDLFAM